MRFKRREFVGDVITRWDDSGSYVSDNGIGLSSNDCILPPDFNDWNSQIDLNGWTVLGNAGSAPVLTGPHADQTWTSANLPKLYADSGVFLLNAGSLKSFPWLAEAAQHFEFFKINSLTVEYVPTVSSYTTNNTPGTIMMACRSDVSKGPFLKKSDFLEYDGAVVFQANQHFTYECKMNRKGSCPVSIANYLGEFSKVAGSYSKNNYNVQTIPLLTQDLKSLIPGLLQISVIGPVNPPIGFTSAVTAPTITGGLANSTASVDATIPAGCYTPAGCKNSVNGGRLDNRIRLGELYFHYDIDLFNPVNATQRILKIIHPAVNGVSA